METIKILEKRWRSYPLLVIHNYEHDKKTPMKQFILDVFTKYNTTTGHETYTKKTYNRISYRGSKRSFIDIFGLCRNYYRGVKLKDVILTMMELADEGRIHGWWFCETIRRYVFDIYPHPYSGKKINSGFYVSTKGDIKVIDILNELNLKIN